MYVFHRRSNVTFIVLPFCHLTPNSIITKLTCLLWCPPDQWLSSRFLNLPLMTYSLCWSHGTQFLSMRMITVLPTFNPFTWAVHKMAFLLSPHPSSTSQAAWRTMQSSKMAIHIPFPMQPISPIASYGFMLFEIRWPLLLRKQSLLACDNTLPQEWRKCAENWLANTCTWQWLLLSSAYLISGTFHKASSKLGKALVYLIDELIWL